MRRTSPDQDLYAAFVNPSTGTVSTPFAIADVDSPALNVEFVPALATDAQGAFLAVWKRETGSDKNIFGQLFDSSGLVGGVITITNDSDAQDNPVVSFDQASQQYLVTWEDNNGGDWHIYGQFLDTEGTLVGGNFPLVVSNGHVDPHAPAEAPLDNHYLVGFDRASNAYLSLVNSGGIVLTETTLSSASNNQRAVALASDANANALAVWESNHGAQGYDIYGRIITANLSLSTLQTTTISYTYDALYRLTHAQYTGAISATYLYRYDPVGNMTSYTQTITSTTYVTRSFDRANQLQTSLDLDAGTTSYYYDNNGNLREIMPPGATSQFPGGSLRYGYDQRNLMITNTLHISGTGWVQQAAFAYDGASNRLRQVDYTGSSPITTTYTNDILGLSQVLVAQQGANQVHNLFGLDLIHQDTPSQTLTLLTDGLGSVRLELVATTVAATTTYDPYGNLLASSGSGGTNYGFTGEQEDSSTGLLYLRARYYAPYLNQFQSRDPFPGYPTRPASLNGYSYVYNSPTNLTDPSGLDAWWCDPTYRDYSSIPGYGVQDAVASCYSGYPLNQPGYPQADLGLGGFGSGGRPTTNDPRDLTRWLYYEMMANLNDPRLQNIRRMNQAGDVGLTVGSGLLVVGCFTNPVVGIAGLAVMTSAPINYGTAFVDYYNLVGDRKPWDFKHEIRNDLGPGITLCSSSSCKSDIEYSVPGNIHFGFITREAGYHSVVTHLGAGFAQAIDPNEPYTLSTDRFGPVVGPSGISLKFGDDLDDHQAVQFGVYLYNQYGRRLTFTQFRQELGRFMSHFDTNPPRAISDILPNVAADWPYWVGYFNP